MKITCNSCQSKYTVSDEKVQGKTVKIKCRKCGATILVNSSGATTTNASDPAVAAADAAASGDGPTYLVNVAEGDQRSMSLPELVQAVNASTISRDTYVWADGMADWQPIAQVQSIVDALNASGGGAAAAATPEPAARPAAKREGGRGASRDLFGGDAQGDAPLFSAPKAPAPSRIGAGTEEQSALFSLSALTSRVGSTSTASSGPSLSALASSSSTSSKPLNTEDSGLIDLKALAASVAATKESAASATPNLLDDPGGLFQMGGPSLTTATAAPTVSTPEPAKPQKNRTPLYIGVGAVLAIGAMVGVFMIASSGPPPVDPAAQTNPTAANTPPPLDTAPPTAAPPPTETAPPASASAVAANSKTPPTKVAGTGGTSKTKTGPAPGPGPAAPAPPPTKTGGGGGCGCPPGDLMCNMRCSAKKK